MKNNYLSAVVQSPQCFSRRFSFQYNSTRLQNEQKKYLSKNFIFVNKHVEQ